MCFLEHVFGDYLPAEKETSEQLTLKSLSEEHIFARNESSEFAKFDPVSQNISLPNECLQKTGALLF